VLRQTLRLLLLCTFLWPIQVRTLANERADSCSFDICGTVLDPMGWPLPTVLVSVHGPQQQELQTRSDENGHYHFNCLPAGTYDFVFSLQGFLTQVQQGVTFSYPRPVVLNPVMQVDSTAGDYFFEPLRLNVLVTSKKAPVAGATVTANGVNCGKTDQCGRLSLSLTEPGKYTIAVTKEGYGGSEETVLLGTESRSLAVVLDRK